MSATARTNSSALPPPSSASSPRIMIVDDDRAFCRRVTKRLSARGYAVTVEGTTRRALDRLEREPIATVLFELSLGGDDGLHFLDDVTRRAPDVPAIVVTARATIDTAVEAMRRGAHGFVPKPFELHDLETKVANAVRDHRSRRASNDASLLLGESAAIERVRRVLARVAKTSATVLVIGETGTGKELAARTLHAGSSRATSRFVAVNCAGLHPQLLEGTLFGHVKGAFTGAIADRAGLFAAAKGGTLFLDEIGEAPLHVQAKLLRALEERRFTPLGSTESVEADVRIVAATNQDLRLAVRENRFREDLFYRLHVVPIHMPPLRTRREDVKLLADVFLLRAAVKHGLELPELRARALTALVEHDWPGNVRELENVIENAALLAKGGPIDAEHLVGIAANEEAFAAAIVRMLKPWAASDAHVPFMRDARDAFESAYVDALMMRTSGSVTAAARIAQRNRTDFYTLLRRHARTLDEYK